MDHEHTGTARDRGDLRLFFFNDTATTEIYTLSLHDALPITLGETNYTLTQPSVAVKLRVPDRKPRRFRWRGHFITVIPFLPARLGSSFRPAAPSPRSPQSSDAAHLR